MPSKNYNPHREGQPQKKSGTGEIRIPPCDLSIIWGGDDRYWNVPSSGNMAAELYQVGWLEVTGCVYETNPNKGYEVGFQVSLAPDAFGWDKSPVYIMIKRGTEGEEAWTKLQINPNITGKFDITGKLMKPQKLGKDQASADPKTLHFGLYEVWSGKWKGGLRIHRAFVKEIQ